MPAKNEWQQWLTEYEQANERVNAVQIGDCETERARARWAIQHQCGEAYRSHDFPVNLDSAATRGDEDARNVRDAARGEQDANYDAAARHLQAICESARRSPEWRFQSREHQALVANVAPKLQERREVLHEAEEVLKAEREEDQDAHEALEDVKHRRPAPTDNALAALDSEVKESQDYIARLNKTLDAMKDETSTIAQAEDAANAAQAELERLEVETLMGSTKESDKAAATTRLAKARKEADKASDLAKKQESARRGLAAMREESEANLERLEKTRRGMARELWSQKMADAEQAILDVLNTEKLAPMIDEINACRDKVSANSEGASSLMTARLKIQMPPMLSEMGRQAPETISI